jgi:hypothetical protein
MLGSKVLSGPPETTLNFVQNQDDSVFVAYFAKTPQISRWSRNISTFPENRLDNDSSNFLGIYLLGKKKVELIERFLDNLFLRGRWGQGKLVPERK